MLHGDSQCNGHRKLNHIHSDGPRLAAIVGVLLKRLRYLTQNQDPMTVMSLSAGSHYRLPKSSLF